MSAGGREEMGQMHPLLVVSAVTEIPHHAVAGVVDGGIESDFLVGAEIVVL